MSSDTWTGEKLEHRYRVLALLGEGGMGRVYRAHDERLDAPVVIKVSKQLILEQAEFKLRFEREIRSLVELFHPHICRITDVGLHDGLPFAVMQYLGGGSLEDRRPKPDGLTHPMPSDSLKEWLPEIAKALDFVHAQGYVHRDVKPDNILFDEHANVYLSDFGIAKVMANANASRNDPGLTTVGFVVGTPRYMAPELSTGVVVDGRVDQYALAVVVYEILTGAPPFESATSEELRQMQLTHAPPSLEAVIPTASPLLSQAVARAMSKQPHERFESCAAFANLALANAPASRRPATLKLPVFESSYPLQPATDPAASLEEGPATLATPGGGFPSAPSPGGRLSMPPLRTTESSPLATPSANPNPLSQPVPPPLPPAAGPSRPDHAAKWLLVVNIVAGLGLALIEGLIAYMVSQ